MAWFVVKIFHTENKLEGRSAWIPTSKAYFYADDIGEVLQNVKRLRWKPDLISIERLTDTRAEQMQLF